MDRHHGRHRHRRFGAVVDMALSDTADSTYDAIYDDRTSNVDHLVLGTDGDDHIIPGRGSDVVCGGQGDDYIQLSRATTGSTAVRATTRSWRSRQRHGLRRSGFGYLYARNASVSTWPRADTDWVDGGPWHGQGPSRATKHLRPNSSADRACGVSLRIRATRRGRQVSGGGGPIRSPTSCPSAAASRSPDPSSVSAGHGGFRGTAYGRQRWVGAGRPDHSAVAKSQVIAEPSTPYLVTDAIPASPRRAAWSG